MKKTFFFLLILIFLNSSFAYSQSQWANNGNHIYNTNSGSVGIGISNPVYSLEVNGGVYTYDGLISNVKTAGGISGHFRGAANGNGNVVIQGGAGIGYNAWWLTGEPNIFKIGGAGGTEPSLGAINIDYAGKVGIGMNPGFQLDVSSTGRFGSPSNTNANLIIQGGAGVYNAFWLTSTSSTLKIGGIGGTEPPVGAVNIDYSGKVGIGTIYTGSFKLAVEGKIGAREIWVTQDPVWPDYVFHKSYSLLPLSDLEKFILLNNRLPNIPSAQQVKENGGIDIGDMTVNFLSNQPYIDISKFSRGTYFLKIKTNLRVYNTKFVRL